MASDFVVHASLSSDSITADGSANVSCYMVITDFMGNPVGDMGGECITLLIDVNGSTSELDAASVTIGDVSSGYPQDATVYWTPASGTSGGFSFTVSFGGQCIGYSGDLSWDTGNTVAASGGSTSVACSMVPLATRVHGGRTVGVYVAVDPDALHAGYGYEFDISLSTGAGHASITPSFATLGTGGSQTFTYRASNRDAGITDSIFSSGSSVGTPGAVLDGQEAQVQIVRTAHNHFC